MVKLNLQYDTSMCVLIPMRDPVPQSAHRVHLRYLTHRKGEIESIR